MAKNQKSAAKNDIVVPQVEAQTSARRKTVDATNKKTATNNKKSAKKADATNSGTKVNDARNKIADNGKFMWREFYNGVARAHHSHDVATHKGEFAKCDETICTRARARIVAQLEAAKLPVKLPETFK